MSFPQRLALVGAAVAAMGCALPTLARGNETVSACASGEPNLIWASTGGANAGCSDSALGIFGPSASAGVAGSLTANAPGGLEIVSTPVPFVRPLESDSQGSQVDDQQWESQYIWQSGELDLFYSDGDCLSPEASAPIDPCIQRGSPPGSIASSSFTIDLTCTQASCSDRGQLVEPSPSLVVAETQQPTLSAANGSVGSDLGWVRGSWPLSLSGDAPSGLCSISAQINGLGVGATSSPQNGAAWKQCSSTTLAASIDTTKFPNGPDAFSANATSAADNTAPLTHALDIDNSTPNVSLSGPADVPAGSGPAQLTATATAGPSGVGEIDCSVDGTSESFPESGQPSATATLTFSGLGAHSASCEAANTAQATDGRHAWSPVATGNMTVRTPTAALASFSKLVDKKVCHAVMKKVDVPAGWHEIRWHGHKVRARLPAHKVRRKVRQCRTRLAKRRIVVFQTVRRHGQKIRIKRHRVVKVPVQPHTVTKGIRTVRFGRTTTLHGTLEAADGQALAGQAVTVLGLPRNTHGNFKPLATTTTDADGAWKATIPRGPGRILEASYSGASTTEPATSDQVRTVVHARVKLSPITSRRVPWAGKITLRGKLPGGRARCGCCRWRRAARRAARTSAGRRPGPAGGRKGRWRPSGPAAPVPWRAGRPASGTPSGAGTASWRSRSRPSRQRVWAASVMVGNREAGGGKRAAKGTAGSCRSDGRTQGPVRCERAQAPHGPLIIVIRARVVMAVT